MGEADAAEEKAVAEWLNADAANSNYYLQLKKIWETSKNIEASSTIDEDQAWKKFQLRVEQAGNNKKKVADFKWMKIAASVIGLIGLSLLAYLLLNRNAGYKELILQTAQNVVTDTLSDGSVVTLNKRSSIRYKKDFKGNNRAVDLTGEAFFKVAPDKKKPFIITVNTVQVIVVGTSFNIKSENGNTEVIVETGIVDVVSGGKSVQLIAGEKLVLTSNNAVMAKEKVNGKLYNYYRSKEFVCDDTPLWKLVEVLNAAYDANISIGRAELRDLKINTTFNNESLDKILEIIQLTFDIKITRKEGEVILQ